MAKARLYDISQSLSATLPVWPGDTAFLVEETWTHGPQCPVAVAKLTLSPHSGSHTDAPLHYAPDGVDMAGVALDAYIGRARVVDLSGRRGPVVAGDLAPWLDETVERVLVRTFERFPHDRWVSQFAPISAEAIDLLAAHGVTLIGTDAPSLDPETSKTMDAHRAVRAAGMHILEGIVLDDVPPGDYELIALPLKLVGVDASPVRAILRDL
jgi:arylformamidase